MKLLIAFFNNIISEFEAGNGLYNLDQNLTPTWKLEIDKLRLRNILFV